LNEREHEKQYRSAARRLYDLVFAPPQNELGSARMIYIAADDQLNLVPFEALVEKDQYLVENYRFAYLTSGRDLLRNPAGRAQGTVVFADPDYEMSPVARAQKVKEALAVPSGVASHAEAGNAGPEPTAYTGALSRKVRGDNQARSGRWDRLEGSAKEAEDVEQALTGTSYGPVKKYLGPEALEEVFKRIRAPRVLSVSTHGFFPSAEASDERQPFDLSGGSISILGQKLLQRTENPLLSSGLVLAGANTIGQNSNPAGLDDGWVTAEEIAMMDLQGTELVVLSACGTGLGKVSAGEGVYGLRRAFQNAGARTIISTLFKVPDKESAQMMKMFYEGLKAGKGKLESLHEAQLGVIAERRKKEGTAHPFFWASFVLSGDPN